MKYILIIGVVALTSVYSARSNKQQAALQFLYNNKAGTLVRRLLSQGVINNFIGLLCDIRLSKYAIKSFIKTYNINMDEALITVDKYTTFNHFFSRKLKPESRPIHPALSSIISPADGKCCIIENISPSTRFPVKNIDFDLASFLNNAPLAQEYYGGTLLLFRLDPWDYHRFHMPLEAYAESPILINGLYESVNPLCYKAGIQALTQNKRYLIALNGSTHATLMVAIGALCVGRMEFTYQPQSILSKGSEVGYFEFGGSTVALLFKPNTITIEPHLIAAQDLHGEIEIKMGEPIAYQQEALP